MNIRHFLPTLTDKTKFYSKNQWMFPLQIKLLADCNTSKSAFQLSCCRIRLYDFFFFFLNPCTQPEEARKKKSLLNIRNAGTHLARLSTPNLPALTDVAISHKNTIMAHDPGHPLHCHFTKVPLATDGESSGAKEPISAEALHCLSHS